MNSDTNTFCIWDAAQNIYLNLAKDIVEGKESNVALDKIVNDLLLRFENNPGFLAKLITPPSEEDIAVFILKTKNHIMPETIYDAREKINQMIANSFKQDIIQTYNDIGVINDEFNKVNVGFRLLKNRYLDLMVISGNHLEIAHHAFENSTNMTETLNSLKILVKNDCADNALLSFYQKWKHNSLLIDKWFSIQAIFTPASNILQTIERLSLHPDFNYKNPNRFRSLIGSFAFNNHKSFHSKDGSGYEIVSKWIKKMDKINPQIAARLSTSFETINRIEPKRKSIMVSLLNNIRNSMNLSKDTLDITDRILKLN